MSQPIPHATELDRVRANTWPEWNTRLDAEATARIDAALDQPATAIDRLQQLEQEWDFDRVVEGEAALTGLLGLALAVGVNRRFLLLPGVAAAMLLLHGTHGAYPWLPLFRRLGIRTRDEIDRERYALKALRGDFANLPEAAKAPNERALAAWRAVCA